jgi:lysyl-tRNA synthetase class 2
MPINSRQVKLEKLIKSGQPVYPHNFPGRETIKSILWQYNSNTFAKERLIPNLDPSKPVYKIAGRLIQRRDHGKNIFFTLMDQTGEIQLLAKKECLIKEYEQGLFDIDLWEQIQNLDLGDMVGITGTLGTNPRGEPLLEISNLVLLAKALKEPGDKFHGITDSETKYRHRELDLLSSADSREVFKKRAEIVFEIRRYLNDRDYVEIECPILQPVYGGATARPFKTRHNSLGQDFFLSISSELYLKRAMVGGFDRVYSFGRCFRNEGISPEHNPEFTNLEIFSTCSTANDMQIFVDNLIYHLAKKFKRIGMLEKPLIEFKSNLSADDWPLSRRYDKNNDNIADAWELYINDMEIASGASDLNDPHEQEERFKEHIISEFNPDDPNYIEALKCGALPWAGVGIGVDRLCMLLLGKSNIREILMFPTLKNI